MGKLVKSKFNSKKISKHILLKWDLLKGDRAAYHHQPVRLSARPDVKQRNKLKSIASKTSGGQRQENMRRPMLKILPHHIMIHHIVAAAEGGCHYVVRGGRRPPLIMWCGSIFSIGLRIFSCLWPPLVFLAIGFSLFHFLMDLSS